MGPGSNFDPNQPIPHKSLDNTSTSLSRVILIARRKPEPIKTTMFLQRSAITAARRAIARPAVARTFVTSVVRRTHFFLFCFPEPPHSQWHSSYDG
jgi:cytochrome c oxidase subunit 5b